MLVVNRPTGILRSVRLHLDVLCRTSSMKPNSTAIQMVHSLTPLIFPSFQVICAGL